jgi:Rrf2 family protein
MRVSRSSLYAIHGLTLLAGALPDSAVPLPRIQKRVKAPRAVLAKIFQALARVGLLRSSRGVKGGFALARPANSITALDVIRAVDGPLPEDDCPTHPDTRGPCCAVSTLLRQGQRGMEHALGRATLADLAGRLWGGASRGARPRPRL